MGLETGTQIGELVEANPPGTDPKSQGDDHLRLIKTCVKGSLGDMAALWAIPGNAVPLRGETTTPGTYRELIQLNSGNEVELSQAGVETNVLGGLRVTGIINSTGALTVQSGGASITGTLTQTGSANITGVLSVLGGNNMILSSGSDFTMTLGDMITSGTVQHTLTASVTDPVQLLRRTPNDSNPILRLENLNASGTAHPTWGLYHHPTNGAFTIGNSPNVATAPFGIDANELVYMANLPTVGTGPVGSLWVQTGDVRIVQ